MHTPPAWNRLGLPPELLGPLLARWAEPHRSYHGPLHLAAVLAHIETLKDHATTPDLVVLAAYYHDAVHLGRPDDEEASAHLAEQELTWHLPTEAVDEVVRLVLVTKDHRTTGDDPNGEVLCDADLAVLGSTETAYDAYTAAVRAEYSHVSDADFRVGRSQVLRDLLGLRSLFRTPRARALWEERARANLKRELARLREAGLRPGG
ncbi:HD domain-containing protein [Actinokineospora pegani]|uniref:HD domain-containing protein n=1 Tax=Actinokineospora pegani TaxID=2654637 RepID=UPI0012E9F023|nr:metal-dependent phosphohydrolase [Actinokineospora pegani]